MSDYDPPFIKKSSENNDLKKDQDNGDVASTHMRRSRELSHDDTNVNPQPAVWGDKRDVTEFRKAAAPPPAPAQDVVNKNGHSRSPAPTTRNGSAQGRVILKNRFLLEETLGVGGMGIVYKARDKRKVEAKDRNPYVAIKILNEDFKKYPSAFIALQREARKSQSIAHPNIVNVHDFDRDGETVFMTMEYMDGQPLDKLLRERHGKGLPLKHATEIFKGLCAALQHAHAENIVHSDFKPGNIYITRNGVAKVFDFGIARAVATVDRKIRHHEETLFTQGSLDRIDQKVQYPEKSLFDPDTLGALTPAYASYEMLKGDTPTTQDDIFALAVVLYEMLAGEHPYKRLHADEAFAKKLHPKRIRGLKRYQWNALKHALEIKREQRTSTVHEFLWDFTQERQSQWPKRLVAAALIGAGVWAYFQYVHVEPQSPEALKAQLERQIKFELVKQKTDALLADATFSELWQSQLWDVVSESRTLLGDKDQWLLQTESHIVGLYVAQIKTERNAGKLMQAQALFEPAKRYRGDHAQLKLEQVALDQALEEFRAQQQLAREREKEKARQLAELRARETKQPVEKPRPVVIPQTTEDEPVQSKDVFALAMQNIKEQLRCSNDINSRNFGASVHKARSIDKDKFQLETPRVVTSLASCIEKVGQRDSNRGEDLKGFALQLFPGNRVLSGIKIKPVDPCNARMAGLGSRGSSGTCRDRLFDGNYGPRLVVVPAANGINAFAIGQFEVSVGEINEYCSKSRQCEPLKLANNDLPATNIDFDVAKNYARWLSSNSGYTYRIPRNKEWLHAASADNSPLDENRNCSMQARGINKGENMDTVTTGRKNNWGLVNHVGNAQEWVLVNNRDLVAAGGAHTDPIGQCALDSRRNHNGKADAVTGFRLVREISR